MPPPPLAYQQHAVWTDQYLYVFINWLHKCVSETIKQYSPGHSLILFLIIIVLYYIHVLESTDNIYYTANGVFIIFWRNFTDKM